LLPYDLLNQKDADNLMADRLGVFSKDPGPEVVTYMFHPGVELWPAVACIFLLWRCGKFAFKRLVLNYLPPERIKEK
jgi:hypothetical protein